MKYELPPNNRNCPNEVLLADLRAVAGQLGVNTVRRDEYKIRGRFNPSTLINRFGSWNCALTRAGLITTKLQNIPMEDLLADLKTVAEKIGSDTVTLPLYHHHGRFAVGTITRSFGTWPAALCAAGLSSTGYIGKIDDDQLFDNMAQAWEKLGRPPKRDDMAKPISRFTHSSYTRRFGSWRKALEAFVASVDGQEANTQTAVEPQPPPSASAGQPRIRHRTSRTISWRLRFLVMRRDNFKCRITGRSPATDPTVILEVDHIISWDKGGETVMENLQTLVKQINIGKSNLDMYADGQPPSAN